MKRLGRWFAQGWHATVKVATMEHITESSPEQLPLFRFDSADSLKAFQLLTDRNIGGLSTASFSYDEQAKCAVFEGNLDLTPPEGADNSGFAALVSLPTLGPWNLENYDAVMLRCKPDHRMYVTNIKAPSVVEGDMFQSYTLGKAGEWQDILLPFDKFILTHRGFVEGQLKLDPRWVEGFGVLMAQRKEGAFRLELQSISAVKSWKVSKRWTGVDQDYD